MAELTKPESKWAELPISASVAPGGGLLDRRLRVARLARSVATVRGHLKKPSAGMPITLGASPRPRTEHWVP